MLQGICNNCNKEIFYYPSKPKKFCSKQCMGINWRGKNNPNFNNFWSIEQKEIQSKKIKQTFINDPSLKIEISKVHTGKILSSEHRKILSEYNKNNPRLHTEKSKEKIGIKSKEKFTPEYKNKIRKINEENGLWKPLSEKSEYEIYFMESNWIERMFNLIENEEEINLLNNLKVFNSKTNRNGVVRDHNYSRWDGFNNKVFPELLRHPVNCKLMVVKDNTAKRSKSILTLEELLDKIVEYKGVWKEQELCINLVNQYKKGLRWKRKEVHQ